MTYVAPANEVEVWYARLPWEASQAVFMSTAAIEATVLPARIGWHGTSLKPERGAFAVAQKGGIFDAWVGERVRVRPEGSPLEAFVYVHDVADIDQDISLPRRAFLALELLSLDEVDGDVTRMR